MAGVVWRRDARAFYEFVDELDRHHNLGDDLDARADQVDDLWAEGGAP
jgi:hypothetical protein